MADKYYNLTKKPNEGVQDKSPEWMDTFFNTDFTKKESGKLNPFAGINDPILNPNKEGIGIKVQKCGICGAVLGASEVGVCKNCL